LLNERVSRPYLCFAQFDFLVRNKIADGALIAKWRKPGYEYLCSMLAIQKNDSNFGTASLCRVPISRRPPQNQLAPSVRSGCVSCASQDSVNGGPIWWNTPIPNKITRRLKGANRDAPPPAEGEADAAAATGSHQERRAPDLNEAGDERERRAPQHGEGEQEDGEGNDDEGQEQQHAASKRPLEEDDEVPEEVKRRAQALKQMV
jgi:bud site selection protein 31